MDFSIYTECIQQKSMKIYSKSNNSSPADRKTKWSRTEPVHDGEEYVKANKPTIVNLQGSHATENKI